MYVRGQKVTFRSVFLAILVSTAGFIFGYDTGQISGIMIMDDFKRRFGSCPAGVSLKDCTVQPWRNGTITSLLSIGTLFGALAGAPLADYFGRRKAITIENVVFIIGVIIQVTAKNVWQQIAVGRLIAGLGVGALSAAAPLYQAETAPKGIRGTLTATYQLLITLGILVASAINSGTSKMSNSGEWRIPIALGIIWSLYLGIGILFMPESPRWLESNGMPEQAELSVRKLHGIGDPQEEAKARRQYLEIQKAVAEEQKRSKATWADCFRTPNKTLYRTALGFTLQSLQQLTGANYFFYYGAQLFLGVGISDSFVTQIILNAVNVVCTFLGLYVLERYGRRNPLIVGGIWQGIWLLVFASAGTTHDPTTNASYAKLMIVAACLFILGYASTWGPGIWILIGETFPTRTRAKQGAISTAGNWSWNFLIAMFTQPITSQIGFRYGYIFAACNLAASVVVYFFLYESSGLSLEAVDMMYNDTNCKAWQSRSWLPPGATSRHSDEGNDDNVDQATLVDSRTPNTYSNGKKKGSVVEKPQQIENIA